MERISRIVLLLFISATLFMLHGCYWASAEEFYPPELICDTTNVSYSADVNPILTNHCFDCHSNQNAPGFASGISLEGHANASAVGSRIVGAIKHEDGFVPMPPASPMLDSCDILKITAWVNQGSQDN